MQTNLFSNQLKLLHISPKFCLSRQFKKRQNLYYVGADIQDQKNISMKFDLTATPIKANIFDSVICIHVLEHIRDDNKAIQEIYRLLKPGGWAVISVPIRLDKKTFEDRMDKLGSKFLDFIVEKSETQLHKINMHATQNPITDDSNPWAHYFKKLKNSPRGEKTKKK